MQPAPNERTSALKRLAIKAAEGSGNTNLKVREIADLGGGIRYRLLNERPSHGQESRSKSGQSTLARACRVSIGPRLLVTAITCGGDSGLNDLVACKGKN